MKTRLRRGLGAGLLLLLAVQGLVLAHERFVKHDMKRRQQDSFFLQQAGRPLGMDPNMIQVGLLVTVVLAGFLCAWFMRDTLDEIVRYKVLAPLRGRLQRSLHGLACFVMDKPVRSSWFYAVCEWSVIMFLRSPALVVVGTRKARAEAPIAGSIPGRLLATRGTGPAGSFSKVTSIQRVNTSGGMPPSSPCTPELLGRKVRVEYIATYRFFVAI